MINQCWRAAPTRRGASRDGLDQPWKRREMARWFVIRDGSKQGSPTSAKLKKPAAAGKIRPSESMQREQGTACSWLVLRAFLTLRELAERVSFQRRGLVAAHPAATQSVGVGLGFTGREGQLHRVAGYGLENRQSRKRLVGSNPTPSASVPAGRSRGGPSSSSAPRHARRAANHVTARRRARSMARPPALPG